MNTLQRMLIAGLVTLSVLSVATWLALRRPDVPWTQLESRYGDANSRYMALPGGLTVHYRDQGNQNGRVIVLVHGFSASTDAWTPWVARLSESYRVITLDLPGHGLTRAPKAYVPSIGAFVAVVDAVTERLGVNRFVLGGNSMGGGVAWAYALAHPEKLQALILVDAAGWPHPQRAGGALIFQILQNPLARSVLKDLDNRSLIKQGLIAAYLDPALVTPALVDRYSDLARGPGHRDILIALQTGERIPATNERLATLRVPTLVMHGRSDRLIPYGDGEHFATAIPGATLIGYDHVGHVPMEQIPERSATDLKAWLASTVWPAGPVTP